jgi:hypothetical protein
MAKQIELDGKIHEFPDDFTDEDIQKALRSQDATPPGMAARPSIGPIDFTNEMLSNVPRSAGNLIGGMYQAIRHPKDTAGTLVKTTAEIGQKMTPGWKNPTPHADAAIEGAKQRYGSLDAIANTLKTDPVGMAADAAAVAGGVSGVARGAAAAARGLNMGRAASVAGRVADVAGGVSDAVNPVNLVTKPIGAAAKGVAKPLMKSALGLPGRTERYGATPATAALENTSGITPTAVRQSSIARLAELDKQLDSLTSASSNPADLSAARKAISDAIAEVKKGNALPDDLLPMLEQLTKARPGFPGAVTATGELAAQQSPTDFLNIKRQFGKDYTKFDSAAPLKDSTRKVGNQAYHEMSTEFDRAVPGAEKVNQQIQSLIPVRDAAQRASENAGPVQNMVNRATRPTGGLAPAIAGFMEGGPVGAAAALIGQEALGSPTVKIAASRGIYGAGKAIKSPVVSRGLNAAGVSGTVAKRLSDAILDHQEQQ